MFVELRTKSKKIRMKISAIQQNIVKIPTTYNTFWNFSKTLSEENMD